MYTEWAEWPGREDREQPSVLVKHFSMRDKINLIKIIAVAPDEMAYYVDLQLFLGGEIATIPQHYDGNIMMSDLSLIVS